MTTVHLVRHASHGHVGRILTGRAPGAPLTPAGRLEAEALARHFAGLPVDRVLASPRQRAAETAAAIAAAAGVEVETDPDLDEIDFGDWTGRAFADLDGDPAWTDWNAHRATARPPGGETMAEAQRRILRALSSAAARLPAGTVVMVSHADMIKAAVADVLGLGLDAIHRFEIAPASVTVIETGPGGSTLLGLNARPAAPARPAAEDKPSPPARLSA